MTETVAVEAPAAGPLSVEDATAALRSVPTEAVELPPEEQEEPAATSDDPEIQAEPTAEEEPGAETPTEEPAAETPEPVKPAIEPPHFWDAEAKARFKDIPADLQPLVVEQAKSQAAAGARAIEEAVQARKAAEGQASKVTQLAEQLNAFLPSAVKVFGDKWSGHDWTKLAQEDPARYVAEKAQHDEEQQQLRALSAQTAEANRLELQKFHATEFETLAKLAPDQAPELIDAKTAPAAKQAVANYLASSGIAPDRLPYISAAETVIAFKAMKWDQAQAAAKAAAAAPKPKTPAAPKPASGTVRPTAAPALAPSRQRSTEQARANLDKSGSVDDAVALLRSMRG